jgi:hypothetical protein
MGRFLVRRRNSDDYGKSSVDFVVDIAWAKACASFFVEEFGRPKTSTVHANWPPSRNTRLRLAVGWLFAWLSD